MVTWSRSRSVEGQFIWMIAINDDPTFNLVQVDDRRLQPQLNLPGITPQELEPATCKKPWYRLRYPQMAYSA
jgi:hypothetical protein